MATHAPAIPQSGAPADAALQQQPPWRKPARLSSMGDAAEAFLAQAGFDRGPWLAIALMAGIAAWFVLLSPAQWVLAMGSGVIVALAAAAMWRGNDARTGLLAASVAMGLIMAGGVGLVWLRSAMVGTPAIQRPLSAQLSGRILERIEQPAEERVRLVVATREPGTGRAIKVGINVPTENDRKGMTEGAVVRLKARLMPPAPPMLPGG